MKIATHSQRFLHLQIRYENSQIPRIIADVNHFDCFSSISAQFVYINMRASPHERTRDNFFSSYSSPVQLFSLADLRDIRHHDDT